MGLNLVMACRKHKVRLWMYRGHEDGVVDFYRVHWRCNLEKPGTVVLSDDQASDDWVDDDSYAESRYPADDALEPNRG